MSFNDYKDLYYRKTTQAAVTPISVNYSHPLDDRNIDEHQVKQTLTLDLVKSLMKSNMIEFRKQQIPHERRTEHVATVHVADKKFNEVFIDEKVFELNGSVFTRDKIEKALRNTYPEEFI